MDDIYPELDEYDMMDQLYAYQEEENEKLNESGGELLEYCIIPTVLKTYEQLSYVFIICLIFRILTHYPKHNIFIQNISSIIGGLISLCIFFGLNTIHTLSIVLGSYSIIKLLLLFNRNHKGYIVSIFILNYLLIGEFLFNYSTWSAIRGPQMLASMKILSYAFDIDSFLIKDINLTSFCGYILCPANCIFGPWVSYSEYTNLKNNKSWNIKWIRKILISLLLSIIFFIASVCYLEWLIPEESNIIWLVYRNAMLFRVGHYFISYISEITSILSGFGGSEWDFEVVKPLSIELPYSLVQVVINWNIPMHKWLKTYIFKTTLHFGSFFSVMLTYLVSSLLHGFNLRIASVLLSLGIYTYVEHNFRNLISKIFNACLTSKPCLSNCRKHKRTTGNLIVHTVNNFFLIVAVFHLTYLGVLMEVNNENATTLKETYKEWINLNFASHWTILATFCIYLLISVIS